MVSFAIKKAALADGGEGGEQLLAMSLVEGTQLKQAARGGAEVDAVAGAAPRRRFPQLGGAHRDPSVLEVEVGSVDPKLVFF